MVGSERGVGTKYRNKEEYEANQIPEAEESEKVSATAAIAAMSRNMPRSESCWAGWMFWKCENAGEVGEGEFVSAGNYACCFDLGPCVACSC